MKKVFEDVKIEIIELAQDDVLLTSPPTAETGETSPGIGDGGIDWGEL